MSSSYIPWLISAGWASLTLLTFLVLDVSPVHNWVLVTTIAIVPALVLLKLWSDGPPPTIAEVLHETEVGR